MKGPVEGDVIELDAAGSSVGHEQQGCRPVLVVSVDAFHELGLAIVCPISTRGGKAVRPKSSLEVAIPAGLKVTGMILPHQVKAVDWAARKAALLDHVPRATLLAVRSRLKAILGL